MKSYYPLTMASDPTRSYPSELPVLALRQTVVFPLTLQPFIVNQPSSTASVNSALAADRLLFLTFQENDTEVPQPSDVRRVGYDCQHPANGEGAERRHSHHRRRAHARAGREPEPDGDGAESDGRAAARAHRALARIRCVHAPDSGTRRPRADAIERPVAGAARPRRDDRRPASSGLRPGEPARHQAGGQAADPRGGRHADQAQSRLRRAEPRGHAARAEGQDRDRLPSRK